ncbi:MAG: hypothetical protein J1F20_01830 [Muribaculaceae bacterium]|nr:hypothetical protein [Muribaculaceae bacterium]
MKNSLNIMSRHVVMDGVDMGLSVVTIRDGILNLLPFDGELPGVILTDHCIDIDSKKKQVVCRYNDGSLDIITIKDDICK